MPQSTVLENLAADTSPVVLPDTFTHHLLGAVEAYEHTLPNGEKMWPPFVLNGRAALPDLEPLRRPGAGKATPEQCATAADYAYGVIGGRLDTETTMTAEVRRRLADGSLPNDSFNYTGIDCSGFTATVLARSLGAYGIDLYSKLSVSPKQLEAAYRGLQKDDEKNVLLEQAKSSEGLSVRAFTRVVRNHDSPIRSVSAANLAWNATPIRDQNAQSGDIGLYSPIGTDMFNHVALALGAGVRSHVSFAESSRIDPRVEIGGVQVFELPIEDAFNPDHNHHEHGLLMSLRRLNFIQPSMRSNTYVQVLPSHA